MRISAILTAGPLRSHRRMGINDSTRREVALAAFAQRLTVTTEALDMSKSAFGRSIGCDRTRVRHWFKGSNYPDADKLLEIERTHGITPDWLLLGRLHGLPSKYHEFVLARLAECRTKS